MESEVTDTLLRAFLKMGPTTIALDGQPRVEAFVRIREDGGQRLSNSAQYVA